MFFKYSKSELSDEIKNFLEKNKEILSKDFEFEGEKNNIDKARYHICKVENEIEKCILYMNSVRKNYTEEEYLSKNLIVLLKYDVSGKNPEFLSIEDGPIIWLKNNKLERYRIRVRDNNKIIGTITYIFDKKENLKMIEISDPLLIKSVLYGEEVRGYSSSAGSENYYFDPDGKFIKKEVYMKYAPKKK